MDTEILVHIRLPKALHRQLKSKAAKHVRSLNGEIVVALQKYVTSVLAAEQAQTDLEEDATIEKFGNYRLGSK